MVIDGNSYFKKQRMKNMSNEELLVVKQFLRRGILYELGYYILYPHDIPFIDSIMKSRISINK